MTNITIGADPEFFLSTNGKLKSAIDVVGGHKSAPRPLSRPGFFVQEDNVAVEFNIPPATNIEEFCESIQWAIKTIADEVDYQYEPAILASAIFPATELKDARALIFGCERDFNAWQMGQANPRPYALNEKLRSCGGHVHTGYPQHANIDRLRLIQLNDLYLGVPSVLMDEDQQRRLLYGKAGAFRPTDYGVEYRVLSNFWIKTPELISWVFTQTTRAFEKALEFGKPVSGVKDAFHHFMESHDLCDEIQHAINGSNPVLAQKLVAHHDLVVI